MRLTGPGGLAIRPRSWRGSRAVTRHKAGPSDLGESFRLIVIKSQFGLLQEDLAFHRLRDCIRERVSQGQSGCIRDVGDAHLLLHEIMAVAVHDRRVVCAIHGDLQKAFPRTWRQSLLHSLSTTGGVQDGALALLGSIFDEDHVHVFINGAGMVVVAQGIAEGGVIGPLTFPIYMEELTRELQAAGHGVGIGITIPEAWGKHVWMGSGTPRQELVGRLVLALHGSVPLPAPDLLRASPDLEASALRALDLVAPLRLAAILHADDPVLLSSSWGGAQQSLDILTSWTWKHKASPHSKPDKHAAIIAGGQGHPAAPPPWLPLYLNLCTQDPVEVHYTCAHK